MKLPYFPARRKVEKLSPQDEKIFAEASELAMLRLEQCIADLRIWVPAVNESLIHTKRQARKFTN